jgi:hypothetical protein
MLKKVKNILKSIFKSGKSRLKEKIKKDLLPKIKTLIKNKGSRAIETILKNFLIIIWINYEKI